MGCKIEECQSELVLARGMCSAHYSRWLKRGKPPLNHDYRTPIQKFDEAMERGEIERKIKDEKYRYSDLSAEYNVSITSIQKRIIKYGLQKHLRNRPCSKIDKAKIEIRYDDAKMMALAMAWTNNNDTPRYHLHH